MLTNALILDYWGVVKADIGIKDKRIVGIGKAGNPDVMDGVDAHMIVGVRAAAPARPLSPLAPGPATARLLCRSAVSCCRLDASSSFPRSSRSCLPRMCAQVNTEVLAAEGLIVTAGGIDTHVHFICPQLADQALSSGKQCIPGPGRVMDAQDSLRGSARGKGEHGVGRCGCQLWRISDTCWMPRRLQLTPMRLCLGGRSAHCCGCCWQVVTPWCACGWVYGAWQG